MEERKYFKYKITELEEVYSSAGCDFAILEDLEEELEHRSTQRAKRLLKRVSQSLESTDEKQKNASPSTEETVTENVPLAQPDGKIIDWPLILSAARNNVDDWNDIKTPKALHNNPIDIIEAWTVLEALSPQTFKKDKELIIGKGSIAYFSKDPEPWLKGEKSRPKNNLYYLVYLGAVKLEQATEQLLIRYQDKSIEHPSVKGQAALGVVLLNKKGIPVPDTGLALSSFAWAYARALQGNLHELKSWETAEEVLKDGLQEIIYQQDKDGEPQPFSLNQAYAAHDWLVKNCQIPSRDCVSPRFTIRLYQPFSKGEPETPLLNSFYLDDLQRAKKLVKTGKAGKALSQYLGISKHAQQFDLLKDKSHIEKALQPKNTPAGRWPGKGRHSLVLLQQTAVNLAMQELKSEGLFSVNGPPGTGKTTLLRDVVSAVLVERAKALCTFKDTDDAFTNSGKMKLGGSFVNLYRLHDSLRGHEIVVASTNNKAVENVSKELPQRSQIAEDLVDLNYFKTVSNALSGTGDETWGLIAAVLGNSKNRNDFINKAWWDKDTGLRWYFLSITGQIDLEADENGDAKIPNVIEECDPPKDTTEAKHRWETARNRFSGALEKVNDTLTRAQRAYEYQMSVIVLQGEIAQNLVKQASKKDEIEMLAKEMETLQTNIFDIKNELSTALQAKMESKQRKPGIIKRLFSRNVWRCWKATHDVVLTAWAAIQKRYSKIQTEHQQLNESLKKVQETLLILESKQNILQDKFDCALAEVNKEIEICGGKLVTPSLWQRSHEEQQTFEPNFLPEVQRLRDDVFVAAIELHKAFIDASAKQLRQNLGIFFYCLSGGKLPHDKQALLPHIWSCAFLLTPVISTAFASVNRMFKNLPSESLGWLLIDEAGQATPQAAVGAICRSKRVMSVGDPLQIEPVVTLPPSLVEGISKYMGVDPYQWMAENASVQSVSDVANNYGTTIPRDLSDIRIGSPLLVHRRCENPMFKISNKLAYSGQMVYATKPQPSELTALFDVQARWFDVQGTAEEKWCPEEGEYVVKMIIKMCSHLNGDPDTFIITPFRIVAERMRQRMNRETDQLTSLGIEDPVTWITSNIGTVHTFQGKEATAAILLLGAPNPTQNGARMWATSKVNILNVAVSRAKQNFYVIGNKRLWGELGNMKLVSKYLK